MVVANPSLVVLLRLLATERHLAERLGGALAPHRLGLAEYEVLLRVSKAGPAGLRMQELARRVLRSSSGLTRVVERLESAGLISRRSATDDQRGRTCEATPRGAALIAEAQPAFVATLGRVFAEAGLTNAELVMLGDLLGKIATTEDADEHTIRPRRPRGRPRRT